MPGEKKPQASHVPLPVRKPPEFQQKVDATSREALNHPHVVELERPEAHYRIVYSNHAVPTTIEEVGDANLFLIEYGGSIQERRAELGDWLTVTRQEPLIRTYAQEKKIPLAFVDANVPSLEAFDYREKLKLVEKVAATGVLLLLFPELVRSIRDAKMTRRSFLLGAVATVAAGKSLPLIIDDLLLDMKPDDTGRFPEGSKARLAERTVIKIRELTHAELDGIVLRFRNWIMAHKSIIAAEHVARTKDLKPTAAVMVGARHIGIEDAFRASLDERRKVISALMDEHAMDSAMRDDVVTTTIFDPIDSPDSKAGVRAPQPVEVVLSQAPISGNVHPYWHEVTLREDGSMVHVANEEILGFRL